HDQGAVDRAQYGEAAQHPALGAADYKLAVHLPGGRSVYTFCMCPGGEVVCAASEPDSVVVNGMSRHARDGQNANSALLVGVGPEDFGSDDPLA
ncbi:MAG: FAD-dependent oxidoreductase, partial [Gordonibacter sp.]